MAFQVGDAVGVSGWTVQATWGTQPLAGHQRDHRGGVNGRASQLRAGDVRVVAVARAGPVV